MRCLSCLVSMLLIGGAPSAYAQNLPSYMDPISGVSTSTPTETATKDVLALNTGMFELYGDAGKIFRTNILAKHPVILGLFSGAGGRFILYRPGMAPIDAPPVPVVYQLLKSIGHSTMALSEVVGPYLNNPDNKCIGFISFTTLQQQRIFISRNVLIAWNYQPYYGNCILRYDIPSLISTHFQPPGGPYGNSLIGQGLDTVYHFPVYLYSTNLCVDCTYNGGSPLKPSYWP